MRFLTAIALSIWVVSTAASSAESELAGKVLVANVVGKVEAVHPETKSSRSLKNKDVISEEHTVNVGTASKATLVFSNGATISLLEKSSLVISEFLQDPFSVPFSMVTSTEEPTTSTTKLNLIKGEVICKVKKLRTDEGSSLTINTPVGAAGIRGTTLAVSYLPNLNGTDKGTYTLSVTEGSVLYTDSEGNETLVAAGQEIVISFMSTVDPLTGETTVTKILNTEVRNIPAGRLNMITQVAEQGEVDAKFFIFDATEGVLGLPNINVLPGIITPNPVTDLNPQSN